MDRPVTVDDDVGRHELACRIVSYTPELGANSLGSPAPPSTSVSADRSRACICFPLLFLPLGEQLRRLAVEIEVRHGRLALGAVVCAMARQGLLGVAA